MNVPMDQMLEVVRDFIRRKRGDSARSITADSKLLQDGLIDSFALVELIVDLEKELQISLPDGSLIPEDFETPKVLYDRLQDL
jgi:acyl carrier protein